MIWNRKKAEEETKPKKQFIVIGLGRFGASVAETLYKNGHDVLAVDSQEERIQLISNKVTHAVVADATDENALRAIGVRNFDVAVVSIGENLQGSIMATLLMKELGVEYVITKANNAMHAKVLMKIGADRVVFPEKDMGMEVAKELTHSNVIEYIEISTEYSLAEFKCPNKWIGNSLIELDIRQKHGINIIGIRNSEGYNVSPMPDEKLKQDDIIIGVASSEDFESFEKFITKK